MHCRMRGRLVSEGLSLSVLSLAGDQRQLPCGDDYKEYVVHLDSGFAIHCTKRKNKKTCLEHFRREDPPPMPVEGYPLHDSNTAPVSNFLHDKSCKPYGSN